MTRLDQSDLAALGYRECSGCRRYVKGVRGHKPGCIGDTPREHVAPEIAPVADVPGPVSFAVPGRPVGYKRVGGTFTDAEGKTRRRKDGAYRKWQRHFIKVARLYQRPDGTPRWPKGTHVAVWVDVYLAQPANGREAPDTGQHGDTDNFIKSVGDSAQQAVEKGGCGSLWDDDGQALVVGGFKAFADDDVLRVYARAVTAEQAAALRALNVAAIMDGAGL